MVHLFEALAVLSGLALVYLYSHRRFRILGGLVGLWTVAVTGILLGQNPAAHGPPAKGESATDSRPREEKFDGYVSSDTCRDCHAGEHHAWHASYHRTMTQVATRATVRAENFEGRIFRDGGLRFALERRGDELWARISTDDGTTRERRIVMTTGSHNYQAYWLDGDYLVDKPPGDRRVTIFPFVFLLDEKQWVPRLDAFLTTPYAGTNSLHAGEWNTTCLNCHATHAAPLTATDDTLLTTRAVEFGIACEACHGAGAAHVAAHENTLHAPAARRKVAADAADPTIVNPARLGKKLSSEICARCHALTAGYHHAGEYPTHGYAFRPGQDWEDTFVRSRYADWLTNPALQAARAQDPAMLRNLFWPDGMVRVTGREYNGLLETKCFQHGDMSCLSCHRMHKDDDDPRALAEWADAQVGAGMRTNAACVQCHKTLGPDAALTAHTHHPVAGGGSNCYNCHMPHTTFGLLKAIRSHTIDSPSVANSLTTGRPNACNLCHMDKSLGWTAQALHQWYGKPVPELTTDEREIAAAVLWTLKGDAGQRALMAWSFGWAEARKASGDDWMGMYLTFLLEDSYSAVRIVARKSLRHYPGFETLPEYPFPADMKNRAFRLWTRQHPTGLDSPAGPLLLEKNGTFSLEPAVRLMKARDLTPISLRE